MKREIGDIRDEVAKLCSTADLLLKSAKRLENDIQMYEDLQPAEMEAVMLPETGQDHWMMLKAFCKLTGYTPAAIHRKISTGKLLRGVHYVNSGIDNKVVVNYSRFMSDSVQITDEIMLS